MKFLVAGLFLVLVAGFLHIQFIMYDYGFNDPTHGAFTKMQDVMNDTLSPEYRNWTYNHTVEQKQFFGVGRVICIGMCLACFGIEIFDHFRKRDQ